MAKLIFLLEGNVIKEYAVDKERMTIGRRASNDIHIDNLAISGEHAEIITIGEETYIQDLKSTNGTLVNKKQVKKQTLSHGDTIGLGKYQLKYLKDAAVVRPQPDGFADTVLVENAVSDNEVDGTSEEESAPSPEDAQDAANVAAEPTAEQLENAAVEEEVLSPESEATALPDQPPPSDAEKQSPRLQILNGENEGNVLLLDKSMVKVGQPGEQVAVVTKRQEGYFITHVAGDSYPLINGKKIGAQAFALNNHDEIEVLGIKMEFFLD